VDAAVMLSFLLQAIDQKKVAFEVMGNQLLAVFVMWRLAVSVIRLFDLIVVEKSVHGIVQPF
jgi:hypothetical protein